MSEISQDSRFTVTVPLVKAWQDERGQMWFEGVASSTSLDKQRERMTRNAMEKMQQFAGIDLLPSHKAGLLEELGTVEECWADNDTFRVKGRLDETSPQAQRLFKHLVGGKQYGLSVGGRVTGAHWAYDQQAGARIKHIDDVVLDHVALCRPERAANPDTYLAVMAKAAEAIAEQRRVPETSEEDLVRRLGQAALEVCRKLWPFGKIAEPPLPVAAPLEDDARLQVLREEVILLRKQLEQVRQQTDSSPAQEPGEPQPGRRQSLVGPGRPAADNSKDFWKGVV